MLTDLSEESIASIFRWKKKEETPHARNRREQVLFHPEDGGDTFV
jgi:hypothetical protein